MQIKIIETTSIKGQHYDKGAVVDVDAETYKFMLSHKLALAVDVKEFVNHFGVEHDKEGFVLEKKEEALPVLTPEPEVEVAVEESEPEAETVELKAKKKSKKK